MPGGLGWASTISIHPTATFKARLGPNESDFSGGCPSRYFPTHAVGMYGQQRHRRVGCSEVIRRSRASCSDTGPPCPPACGRPEVPRSQVSYYLLPSGVTLRALDAWYTAHLSPGPWRDWTPCTRLLSGGVGIQRGWKRGTSFLDIATSEEGNGQVRVVASQSGIRQ
jgi:hypothetical protein